MKKSIKIITLLLALVMLIVSFASCEILEDILNPEDDVEEQENPGGSTDCEHFWMQGVCILCDAKCAHQWKGAICHLCDCYCKHPSVSESDECNTCGKKMVAAEFTITYNVPDTDGNQLTHTEKCDTAMYLDECFTHGFTYLAYILRYGIFDIYVDGVETTDGSMLIDKDCTIDVKLKSDVIRVILTVVDRSGKAQSQRIYLPKSGLSLDKTCLMAYSTSTKFEALLKSATITLDGEKITDGSYKIVKDCSLTISFDSSTSTPSDPNPNDTIITVTLTDANTGEKFEKTFLKSNLVYISEAIKQMAGMDFAQMLKDGEITVNGTTIREDYRIGEDTDIVFSKTPDGMIKVSFTGIPDLGSGAHVNYSALFESGVTFEDAVKKMLGMSISEYEEKYFNTRIAEGPHTEWVAIYPDTVLNNSVAITANIYKEHEKTDKVYLGVDLNFGGLDSQRLELDYGTTLSEALAILNLDFNALLNDNTVEMFFNVYRILGDVKIKYNSAIYGYKLCTKHEWVNRQCTVCGATCNFTYYDEQSCPSCGGNHPSERPEGEIVKVHVYTYDAEGNEVDYCIKEIPSGSDIERLTLMLWGKLEEVLENGTLTVNEKEVTLDNRIKLYGEEKIVYFEGSSCKHEWENSVCTKCGVFCSHNWVNGICSLCKATMQLHIKYEERCIHEEYKHLRPDSKSMMIPYGSSLNYIMREFGISTELLTDSKLYVNDVLITDGSIIFTENLTIIYLTDSETDCRHSYKNGICTLCERVCEHPRWENSRCVKCEAWCNADLEHTFASGYCTNCSCEYGTDEHYINVMWQREDGTYDTYQLPYTKSVAFLVAMACLDYNEDVYDFYIIDAKDCNDPNAVKTPITLDSIIGEISENPCIIRGAK